MKTSTFVVLAGALLSAPLIGCSLKADASDAFREALPQEGDLSLKVPGGGGGSTKTASNGIHVQGGVASSNAAYYVFTRNMTDVVDGGTAVILASIWTLVHSPATTIDPAGKTATWGPGQGTALEPAVWRFVVHEVGDKEYDYELDGRPRASTSEADFKVVLRGHGYGKSRPEHRLGWFQWDHDVARSLDPAGTKSTDSGTSKVTFDLRATPTTIAVELKPTATATWANVKVTHLAEGAGSVDISSLGDIEEDAKKDGKYEDIVLHSRWDKTGAGRSDVQLSGGSLSQLVKASECWSSAFTRSYYTDSATTQPTEGTPSACVFTEAQF
jgi:hypothetical protein